MTTAKYEVFWREGVILVENVSRWREGMSKFLANGGYMSDIQDISDLTKICPKATFMKKSRHKFRKLYLLIVRNFKRLYLKRSS